MVRIPRLKYNAPIEVVWWDANSSSEWRGEGIVKREKPTICHSVGYYTIHNNDSLIISPDYNDGRDRSTILIPRGMIKRVRKL